MAQEGGTIRDVSPVPGRSPHPYLRNFRDDTVDNDGSSPALTDGDASSPPADQDPDWATHRRASQPHDPPGQSDSGSEADDERGTFTKALPAPPVRERKGLRGIFDEAVNSTPQELLTFPDFVTKNESIDAEIPARIYKALMGSPEDLQSSAKFRRSRKSEVLRRLSEVIILGSVTFSIVISCGDSNSRRRLIQVLLLHTALIFSLCMLYISKLLCLPLFHHLDLRIGSVTVPAAFDLAPLIYPTFIPVLVAATASADPIVLLSNCILGLSSLPNVLFPHPATASLNTVHWLIGLLVPYLMVGRDESMVVLYPLLTTLLPPLHYLTTSSLLDPELKLLAVSLVNILCFSSAPHMVIMSRIIWIGGLLLFVACAKIIKWNVALERVPSWRFRRTSGQTSTLKAVRKTAKAAWDRMSTPSGQAERKVVRIGSTNLQPESTRHVGGRASFSEGVKHDKGRLLEQRGRSMTVDLTEADLNKSRSMLKPAQPKLSRRASSKASHWCYAMTLRQAETRKWSYAFYTYTIIALSVLGPIRHLVQVEALQGAEPFGWAMGFLLGDLSVFHEWCSYYHLQDWIAVAPADDGFGWHGNGWAERLRCERIGRANTRLLLFGYWAAIVASGVATVLWLSTSVEVDTRRKVFHGTMVLMLLPTAYVDPMFLALGLVMVLAVFLLLDLIRAAQLRPLSKPLALFLTPYVDGRDLRGPVVVSHIFLLIGCAIPFWLSLVGLAERDAASWRQWEVATRDVSMVAGVVCVGMGDAAASLIGRRYGRHKWPWPGGKSLEGSLAFAAAVTAGLLAARLWLVAGGWAQTWEGSTSVAHLTLKAWLAGCGASMTEAVLTGCNDNVVVPVVLWLLVRGLRV